MIKIIIWKLYRLTQLHDYIFYSERPTFWSSFYIFYCTVLQHSDEMLSKSHQSFLIPPSMYYVFFYSLKLCNSSVNFLCNSLSYYIFVHVGQHQPCLCWLWVTVILLLISGIVYCYTFALGDAVYAYCELLFHTASQHTQKYYCYFERSIWMWNTC